MRLLLFVVFLSLAPQPAVPETRETGMFDIYVRGFRFGTISYSAVETGSSFATASRIEASGLVGALVRARYDARSTGAIRGNRYVPARYEETARRGSRNTVSIMEYRAGVPLGKTQTPPLKARSSDIPPSEQGGTLDPSTAIYVSLRDQPRATACTVDFDMYDGRYRANIQLKDPRPDGENLICSGLYRRVAGYSDDEMTEGDLFPFTALLVPNGDASYRVQNITMTTLYGTARVERR